MKHYLLFYEFVDDFATKRAKFRESHLDKVSAAFKRGEILLAGALTDPLDAGVVLFQSETPAEAEAFVKADPYFINGLVRNWRVREWATVVGQRMSPAT